jgi:hypothetical protein
MVQGIFSCLSVFESFPGIHYRGEKSNALEPVHAVFPLANGSEEAAALSTHNTLCNGVCRHFSSSIRSQDSAGQVHHSERILACGGLVQCKGGV